MDRARKAEQQQQQFSASDMSALTMETSYAYGDYFRVPL